MPNDIYYLRSILRMLREYQEYCQSVHEGWTLGLDILADNVDWLDCYIDHLEKKQKADAG